MKWKRTKTGADKSPKYGKKKNGPNTPTGNQALMLNLGLNMF